MTTETKSSSFNPLDIWFIFWRFLRRYPVFPSIILVVLIIAAIIGPTVAPYERDIEMLEQGIIRLELLILNFLLNQKVE